jgi:sugar (pentulose or hexulose) kinase
MLIPVIAVFDVGKTNKKLFLFDEQYHIVYEKSARFLETKDEDGDSCENLDSLRLSVFDSLNEVLKINKYDIKAINFSTYGASFVYLDEEGKPLTPLYNYLKPYPKDLEELFYKTHGNQQKIAQETASPASGSLNSGMQLYRMKHQKPDVFKQIKYVLHLPQYMSNLITGKYFTDMTSIGCHTQLWDFNKKDYHQWVYDEQLVEKLPEIFPSDDVIETSFMGNTYKTGVGLHDSSAALIPYLVNFKEPFVLLSTGTWCISLNPFNDTPLTSQELENDCLAYMAYHGKPVKASRLFAGFELEQQSKRIAAHFQVDALIFRTMPFDVQLATQLKERFKNESITASILPKQSKFGDRDLNDFANEKEAYHQLVADIIDLQSQSTALIIKGSAIRKIFVDGGFSKNTIYMNLLARAFPQIEVYAASMAQATALGAAVAIHQHWNTKALPNDIIELKYYSVNQPILS